MPIFICSINNSLWFTFQIWFVDFYHNENIFNFHLDNRICLTRDALNSHIHGTRRSTDGKYYIFVILLSKKVSDQDFIYLSNTEAHLALPTHLIVYRQ
jgi:hypothetical protein